LSNLPSLRHPLQPQCGLSTLDVTITTSNPILLKVYDSVQLCFFFCIGTNSARTDLRYQGPTKCLKIHRVLRIKRGYTYQSTLHKDEEEEEEEECVEEEEKEEECGEEEEEEE